MKKLGFSGIVVFAVLAWLGTSCGNEFTGEYNFDVEYTPGFQGPIGYGSLSLEDMLNRFDNTGLISSDSTDLIYFSYAGDLNKISAEQWLTIPSQEFKQLLLSSPTDLPAPLFALLVNDPISISDDYEFAFDHGERIDSVQLAQGSLEIHVQSSIRHTATIYLSSSNIYKGNGDTLNETIQISDASGTFTQDYNIPLDGGKILIDNSDPDTSFMPLNFTLVVNQTPGEGINSDEEVNIQLNIGQMVIKGVYGFVGNQDIVLVQDQELDIGLFQGLFEGNVTFANPRMNMNVHSSFGLPIGFIFDNVTMTFSDGSTQDFLIDDDYFLVDGPDLSNLGQTVTSTISLNRDNSNIEQLFTTDLTKMTYSVRLLTNPDSLAHDNYFLDTSGISVDYDFSLPMNLTVEGLVLQDTIDFDLVSDSTDLTIEDLQIHITTDNGMPVEVGLQVYFADENYTILDSLYADGETKILESGDLDQNKRVIAPAHTESVIDLDQDKIDKILDAKFAFIKGTVETSQAGTENVRFYTDYGVDFKLSASMDLSVNIKNE